MTWATSGLHILTAPPSGVLGGANFYTNGVGNERIFAEQINAMIQTFRSNYVVDTGNKCVPSINSSDLTSGTQHLQIATGVIFCNGTKVTVGSNLYVNLASLQASTSSGQAVFGVVTINSSGSANLTSGTAGTDGQQVFPEIPEDETLICLVYLQNSDATLSNNQIADMRLWSPNGLYVNGNLEVSGTSTFSGNVGSFTMSGNLDLNAHGITLGNDTTIANGTLEALQVITEVDSDLSSVAGTDTTLASAKAIKSYVDTQLTAEDLDFAGDSGTGAVDLDSQSLTISGGTGVTTSASSQTLSVAIGQDVGTSSNVTFGNVTGSTISGSAITGTTIGGITEANLLDKTASETITGTYRFDEDVTLYELDDGATQNPTLVFNRDMTSTPNVNDLMGTIEFKGAGLGGTPTYTYARIQQKVTGSYSQESGFGSSLDFAIKDANTSSVTFTNMFRLDGGDVSTDAFVESVGIRDLTTGSSANVFIGTSDGKLQRSTSSQRYKTNLQNIPYDRTAFHNVTPRLFESTISNELDENGLGIQRWGLIAEDLQTAFGDTIIDFNDNEEVENYDTRGLIAVMYQEIKNLKAEIDELRNGN